MSRASLKAKALSVLAALAVAASPVMGATPAQAMADGRSVSTSSATAQALVRVQIGNTSCSGTMISPSWVLTARHCVPEGQNTGGVAVGSSTSSAYQAISQAIINPNADLALIQLASPNPTFVNFYGAHVQNGESGIASGWGGYVSQRQAVAQQANVQITRRVVNVPSPDRTAIMLEGNITQGRLMPGDSGGPLYINGQLAGVLSMSTASDTTGQDGTVGWYVPVAEHIEWISRQTGIEFAPMAGSPAPLVDATLYPTYIPAPQVYTAPLSNGWAFGSF